MGLGGLISSAFGSKGAKKANKAMQKALGQARDVYNTGYEDISAMYEPYLTPAQEAYGNYVNTINGDTSAFSASPWGQAFNDYVMNNTLNQLQSTAAARGSMLSGNTLQELQTNIQSMLTNDYLNRLNQYLGYASGLGNTGLNITSALGDYRNNLTNNLANTYYQGGQNNAAQQTAKYTNLGNLWGGVADLGMNGLAGGLSGMATNGLSLLKR